MSHDVKYNAMKNAVMIFRSVIKTYKYLGNYISNDLSDDYDINRQQRTLYIKGIVILPTFNMCFLEVKLTLFHAYCSSRYGVKLWWKYKKST